MNRWLSIQWVTLLPLNLEKGNYSKKWIFCIPNTSFNGLVSPVTNKIMNLQESISISEYKGSYLMWLICHLKGNHFKREFLPIRTIHIQFGFLLWCMVYGVPCHIKIRICQVSTGFHIMIVDFKSNWFRGLKFSQFMEFFCRILLLNLIVTLTELLKNFHMLSVPH